MAYNNIVIDNSSLGIFIIKLEICEFFLLVNNETKHTNIVICSLCAEYEVHKKNSDCAATLCF